MRKHNDQSNLEKASNLAYGSRGLVHDDKVRNDNRSSLSPVIHLQPSQIGRTCIQAYEPMGGAFPFKPSQNETGTYGEDELNRDLKYFGGGIYNILLYCLNEGNKSIVYLSKPCILSSV